MTNSGLERLVGNVLRAGVLLALAIVMCGALPYLFQHHAEAADYSRFQAVSPELHTAAGIWTSAMRLQSDGIIQLGLLVLIATPIARVAVATVVFGLERDRLYVAVSLMVLVILLYSMVRRS